MERKQERQPPAIAEPASNGEAEEVRRCQGAGDNFHERPEDIQAWAHLLHKGDRA